MYSPLRRFSSSSSNTTLLRIKTLGNVFQHGRIMSTFDPYNITKDDWTALAVREIPSISLCNDKERLRILILYGSLRKNSYSRFLACEFARLLAGLGADVRLFDPAGLPLKDEDSTDHPKVQELRNASIWSEGMVWVSPEQHGSMTAVFKNQIDWIPLALGSVRPTQGRTLALAQVNGGSQSFNTVNQLRILGRWMRCFTIPNQSSIPKAWTQFDTQGRLLDTGFRERVVDVVEELWKMTHLLRPHGVELSDRYSERAEKRAKGRLLSQAEKESRRLETKSDTAEKTSDEANEPDVMEQGSAATDASTRRSNAAV